MTQYLRRYGWRAFFRAQLQRAYPSDGLEQAFNVVERRGDALRRFSEKGKAPLDKGRSELPGHWDDWMFGRADDPEFPYQCGYSTGYAIVRRWLDAASETASSGKRRQTNPRSLLPG
jgi:hypothetical protein